MLTQCAMSFSGEPSTTRLHLFIRGMRYFTALRSVQYDNFAEHVILSKAKNLFIRGMRYFTALRSVQYDNFAERVILNAVKNLFS